MISNPPMLILDEATSSVDTLTEKKIQQAFSSNDGRKNQFRDCPSPVHNQKCGPDISDGSGAIVEMGTHDELLQKNGYYRSALSSTIHSTIKKTSSLLGWEDCLFFI